jgi:hypothetical protein
VVERVMFRKGLEQFYELSARRQGDGRLLEQLPVRAAWLDERLGGNDSGWSREDLAYSAGVVLSAEDDEPIEVSLRLMKPDETRKCIRGILRGVIWNEASRAIMEVPLIRRVGEAAVNYVRMLQMIEELADAAMVERATE